MSRREDWTCGLHTLSPEELAGDVELFASNYHDLLAIEKLLSDGAGETAEKVTFAVNDNNLEHPRVSFGVANSFRTCARCEGGPGAGQQFAMVYRCLRRERRLTGWNVDIVARWYGRRRGANIVDIEVKMSWKCSATKLSAPDHKLLAHERGPLLVLPLASHVGSDKPFEPAGDSKLEWRPNCQEFCT